MPLVAKRLGDQRAGHHRERQARRESSTGESRIEMRGERTQRIGPFRDEGRKVDVADRACARSCRSTSVFSSRRTWPSDRTRRRVAASSAARVRIHRFARFETRELAFQGVDREADGRAAGGMAGGQEFEAQMLEIQRADPQGPSIR